MPSAQDSPTANVDVGHSDAGKQHLAGAFQAVGIRLTELPITAERVLAAM